MASSSDDIRVTRLTELFIDVIYGRKALLTSGDSQLFLEAITMQSDLASVTHKLISSPAGLKSLQASMKFDTSLLFLNNDATKLLQYLESAELRAIGSGTVLQQTLNAIVDPPFFWDAFVNAFSDGLLSQDAARSFAYLLLQLISLPGSPTTYLSAATPNIMSLLLESPDSETRNLGQKIKHSLPLNLSELQNDSHEQQPGGRHDNGQKDYKEISIMPTAGELLKELDHTYDGLPAVKRERHQLNTAKLMVLENSEDPCLSGSQEPCGTMLKCGIHACISNCHQIVDHSNILCLVMLTKICEKGHLIKWKCHASIPTTCWVCDKAKRKALKKAQRDLEQQRRKKENEERHKIKVSTLEAEISKITLGTRDKCITNEQQSILNQKREELAAAKNMASHSQNESINAALDHIQRDRVRYCQALIGAASSKHNPHI